ncbi:MAG: type II toxin-antitoxin system Phd/YefM family antitoxin [Planctomycetota bacterium]
MVKLHPNILERDGKKEFVVLTYEEFVQVQEALEDYEDLKDLRAAKAQEGDAPTKSLEQAKEELGL